MSRLARSKDTSYPRDWRTPGPARKTSFEIPNLRRACENAQHCCRLPCEEHFSCVSWMVSQSLRQPESWECHTERSRRSWHAREQNLRDTCGQCLRQVVVDPSGGTSSWTRERARRTAWGIIQHPPDDLRRD